MLYSDLFGGIEDKHLKKEGAKWEIKMTAIYFPSKQSY